MSRIKFNFRGSLRLLEFKTKCLRDSIRVLEFKAKFPRDKGSLQSAFLFRFNNRHSLSLLSVSLCRINNRGSLLNVLLCRINNRGRNNPSALLARTKFKDRLQTVMLVRVNNKDSQDSLQRELQSLSW
jgi:hypothetical protein